MRIKSIQILTYQNQLAGQMLSRCAFLLLPMSATAILTSILNSLGFEKQTLYFSLIGSAALLLCILFLPAYVGIYAFPIGMGAQFVLEAALSLRLLKKHCPISKSFFLRSAICIAITAPIGWIGRILLRTLSLFLGAWSAPIFSALLLAIIIVLIYNRCKIIKIPKKTSSRP